MPRRGLPTAAYQLGPGEDAPYPTHRPTGEPVRSQPRPEPPHPIKPELLCFLNILDEVEAGRSTPTEVAIEVGIRHDTAYIALKRMCEAGLVRVVAWPNRKKRGGRPEPLYALGEGPSMPRPKPLTRSQINLTYNKKRALREANAILYRAFSIGHRKAATQEQATA